VVEAFVRPPERVIYVVGSTDAYRDAQAGGLCGSQAHKKLASILAHEEWHVLHGGDERGAYHTQLMPRIRLGVRPDGPVDLGVVRAMLKTLGPRGQPDPLTATRRQKRASGCGLQASGPSPVNGEHQRGRSCPLR
jgi:hypothetical protein